MLAYINPSSSDQVRARVRTLPSVTQRWTANDKKTKQKRGWMKGQCVRWWAEEPIMNLYHEQTVSPMMPMLAQGGNNHRLGFF